jgi:hypothetical protein
MGHIRRSLAETSGINIGAAMLLLAAIKSDQERLPGRSKLLNKNSDG